MSAENFPHLTDKQLIRRMERKGDFQTDDEELELSRRLGAQALNWRWSDDFFHPKVVVYNPAEQPSNEPTEG